ncbi:Rho guanine nucleotide exchange factor, putative [Entamoeba histolytica HM-1:IMSS-B]|uniref:Rho guanine nucleotide exchange factor, putative n=6 Tax=Entamoeba histolytica TaxID=5759 RepID=C4LU00_ENTH1|nr:Rho guanine nucleotide exchange factor, putative [Entamoeba histolytica HM-1:IMSS]EMD46893.1 rho/RAC guanine nucleotide exchange factor, putative [Entamoeba histolytica KU27]EMH77811.1 Rho guanine nucleotide exchange factor, putative [Entamoeba histolytica HM-1:IMSS-B]EMS14257.1 Rho/RAC guanine nucleotide exchange factor, putative [Entamoeba histolytica HM-3:IMSS]ENY60015.1 Rho/RAC guanine nucleotide exchange factor, putative [Entamoeba histolytica HM-1:IMSS-A]GAT92064.1 rho guanine nucleot|eukprot:XP_656765.1 Rho guanine nucleotide exchange factor, putative [Entamoeba histolytica HM-1:IMSS]
MTMTQRQKIIEEIYTTEEFYIQSMEYCLNFFFKEMKSEKNQSIIPSEDVDIIFEHYDEVLNINKNFFLALKKLQETHKIETHLGQIFKLFTPFFKVYFLYISHYDDSNQVLTEYEKNPKFNELLASLQTQIPTTTNLDLRSYLIMPVQRLPRYELLLKDLLKNTKSDHPDYAALTESLNGIRAVTMEVNERTKDIDRRAKVIKVNSMLSGLHDLQLVEPDRTLIMEGQLIKVCKKSNKPRYFYLFDDVMVYGIGNQRITVSGWFYLKNVYLENDSRFENSFKINNDKKSFSVICETSKQKKDWYDALTKYSELQRKNSAIENTLQPKTTTIPDNEPKNCLLCKQPFTFVNRKHHCRLCGRCVCSNCSKAKIPLNSKGEIDRVCNLCFSKATGKKLDDGAINQKKPIRRDCKRSNSVGNPEEIFDGLSVILNPDIQRTQTANILNNVENSKSPLGRSIGRKEKLKNQKKGESMKDLTFCQLMEGMSSLPNPANKTPECKIGSSNSLVYFDFVQQNQPSQTPVDCQFSDLGIANFPNSYKGSNNDTAIKKQPETLQQTWIQPMSSIQYRDALNSFDFCNNNDFIEFQSQPVNKQINGDEKKDMFNGLVNIPVTYSGTSHQNYSINPGCSKKELGVSSKPFKQNEINTIPMKQMTGDKEIKKQQQKLPIPICITESSQSNPNNNLKKDNALNELEVLMNDYFKSKPQQLNPTQKINEPTFDRTKGITIVGGSH